MNDDIRWVSWAIELHGCSVLDSQCGASSMTLMPSSTAPGSGPVQLRSAAVRFLPLQSPGGPDTHAHRRGTF